MAQNGLDTARSLVVLLPNTMLYPFLQTNCDPVKQIPKLVSQDHSSSAKMDPSLFSRMHALTHARYNWQL